MTAQARKTPRDSSPGSLRTLRLSLTVATALTGTSLYAQAPDAQTAAGAPSLEEQFRNPPNSARPRVWWHWLDGNVTKEGIRKDLEWLKSIGVGGVQTFDVKFFTPKVVDDRLVYMSPEWKDAFRYAAGMADGMGLELTIAASPGWSETGAPWVKPADGIKKLVWSERIVAGGRRFTGVLPQPSSISGPFQDIPLAPEPGADPTTKHGTHYGDVAVIAHRVPRATAMPEPRMTLGDGAALDAKLLTDPSYSTGIGGLKGSHDEPLIVNISYDRPQTIGSAAIYIPSASDMYVGPKLQMVLEHSSDGRTWSKVTDVVPGLVPTTVSFAAITASRFRLVIRPLLPKTQVGTEAAPGFQGFVPAAASASVNVRLADLRLSSESRIHQFEAKAGFTIAPSYYTLDDGVGEASGLASGEVVDLTSRMRAGGTLDWTPPKGTWRIVRLGYSLTGKTNHPAPPEATGLEVDKLDAQAVRRYVETYLANYRAAAGSDLVGKRGVNALLTDSTEVGAFNWTPRLLEKFQELRGYDPSPWLLTLTGALVGSRTQSDRFLYDFRQTIADLHASEHYGVVAKVAHENGLKVYGEALEGWRVSLGDDLDMRRNTDVPMAAIWTFAREIGPRPLYYADMRSAASVAHLYGQNLAAAESMTSTRFPFAHAPSDLRRVVDLEFANGINRIIVHTSVHQPLENKPGLSLRHIGQFFTRHETWSGMAKPWIDYIARNSFMLQQGRNVADVAYFYGEDAPTGPQVQDGYFTNVPRRHAYDFVNATALRDALRVEDGELVASGGARYKVLYLGGTSERMTLATLRRIAALAESGATIVGTAPVTNPSLIDDKVEYAGLVARLWSGGSQTTVGTGRVIATADVDAALRQVQVAPDFSFTSEQPDVDVPFVHRRLDDGDSYYLLNRKNRPERIEARFRVAGKAPELWHPDSGRSEPVSFRIEGNETIVPLSLQPEQSVHVVFRKPALERTQPFATPELVTAVQLSGPWTARFQAERGAPLSAKLPQLIPLNEHSAAGIKYFSGVAAYAKEFTTPRNWRRGQPLWLDLGEVRDLAEVWVNGKLVDTVWHAPYRVDLKSAARPGRNSVEIRVANLWVNRLIGDAQPGAKKIGWTSTPFYRADAPLRPAGLMGPVQLLVAKHPSSAGRPQQR